MKADGASEEEIEKALRTKTPMRVFAWTGKDGSYAVDTL
jgi:hypothetical protein